jgi:hypothetical protein
MSTLDRKDGKYKTPLGEFWSVTKLLPPPPLMDWAADAQYKACVNHGWKAYEGLTHFEDREHYEQYMLEVKGAHKSISRTAMDLGSLCHNMIDCWNEQLFDGDFADYQNFLSVYFSSQAINMIGAWYRALKENKIKILKSEMTVWHPLGFAGTLDAVVQFDDALMIADWKTGKDIYYTYWLQTEAYRRAYTYMTGDEPVGRMILRLDKDNPGQYEIKVRPLEINIEIRIWEDRRTKDGKMKREIKHFDCDHEYDWAAFLASKTIFERSKMK